MNDYHRFVLNELLHFHVRHSLTEEKIRPTLYWGSVQSKFLKEVFEDLQREKLIEIDYARCQNCKEKCGHTYLSLTAKGIEKANK